MMNLQVFAAASLFEALKLVIGSALNNNQSEEPIVGQQLQLHFCASSHHKS